MTILAPRLALVHGWGFDAGVWRELIAAASEFLPGADCHTLDFGFFGPPRLELSAELFSTPERPLIAVGHSLGALWLLATRPLVWDGLVAINGFPRFTAAADYAPAVAGRVLERMIRRCDEAPAAVVEEFRRHCGCREPLPGPVDGPRLLAGLEQLRQLDARGLDAGAPLLALGGSNDAILPAGMARQCWTGFARVEQREFVSAGHLLPLDQPRWCAQQIAAWLARWPAKEPRGD